MIPNSKQLGSDASSSAVCIIC